MNAPASPAPGGRAAPASPPAGRASSHPPRRCRRWRSGSRICCRQAASTALLLIYSAVARAMLCKIGARHGFEDGVILKISRRRLCEARAYTVTTAPKVAPLSAPCEAGEERRYTVACSQCSPRVLGAAAQRINTRGADTGCHVGKPARRSPDLLTAESQLLLQPRFHVGPADATVLQVSQQPTIQGRCSSYSNALSTCSFDDTLRLRHETSCASPIRGHAQATCALAETRASNAVCTPNAQLENHDDCTTSFHILVHSTGVHAQSGRQHPPVSPGRT